MLALLTPPTLTCCQWLGLCICHAGQTWGGVHKAFSLLNSSSAQTSLFMLFVSLQGLPFAPSLPALLGSDNTSGASQRSASTIRFSLPSFFHLEGKSYQSKKHFRTSPSRAASWENVRPLSLTTEPCEETSTNLLSQSGQSLCGHCGQQCKQFRSVQLSLDWPGSVWEKVWNLNIFEIESLNTPVCHVFAKQRGGALCLAETI